MIFISFGKKKRFVQKNFRKKTSSVKNFFKNNECPPEKFGRAQRRMSQESKIKNVVSSRE